VTLFSHCPMLSVVLTGYTMRRLPDVLEAIESLNRQTDREMEVIFVGQNDPELCGLVAERARSLGLANFQAVFSHGPPGLSGARNLGAEHSQGEIVAFIDDDAIAFPDWAENIMRVFSEQPEVIAVTGPAFPLWQEPSMQWFPEEFFWLLSCPTPGWTGYTRPKRVRNTWGMNMAFRKEAFHFCRFSEAFGYQEGPEGRGRRRVLGDETEFCLRLVQKTGRPILYHPAVCVWHKVQKHRLSPPSLRQRAFWEGYTKATLVRSNGSNYSIRLSTETGLLRRILLGLIPRTIRQLLDRPGHAWRRLLLTVMVLFHVSLGYAAGRFPSLSRAIVRQYS
jgi:GT2 family glycosyltransferase